MRTVIAALVALLALPLVAGCGGGSAPSALPGGPAATGPSGAASPPAVAASATGDPVLAAYLRFWDAVIRAPRGRPALAGPRRGGRRPAAHPRPAGGLPQPDPAAQRARDGRPPGAPRPGGRDRRHPGGLLRHLGLDPVDLRTRKPVEVIDESVTGRYRARYTLRRAGSGWRVVDQVALGWC